MTASSPSPRVSIIVPCRNEERHIEGCLASILANHYPREALEVLVVDGLSTDRTRERVRAFVDAHPFVRLLDNPGRTAPAALNAGLQAATGDVVMRMDAHAVYPPTYVARLVAGLEETGADNVGGVFTTLPGDGSVVARAIAIGLAHPLGVGNSHHRVGVASRREVDTVPFGCYRRAVFDRIGGFDEELVRNQDDEFNLRLIRHGGRVVVLPDVAVQYFARRTLRQLGRMLYQYGYFKPLVAVKVGRIMTLRQLVPAAFVLSLAVTGLLAPWLRPAALALGVIAGSYALVVVGCSAVAARRDGPACGAALLAVFPVLHVAYGTGFLVRAAELMLGVRRRGVDAAAVPLSR